MCTLLQARDRFAHRHVHFVANQTESQGVQLLKHFQQPLKPVQEDSTVLFLRRDKKFNDSATFFVGVWAASEAPWQVAPPETID